MSASRILSEENPLYLICDGEICTARGIAVTDFVAGALMGKAKQIQYRHKNISAAEYEKNLAELVKQTTASGAKLIVNDHAALAENYTLPLHLGQDDALPPELTVPYGRSTHSIAELEITLSAIPKPDYVALGTMFPGGTKANLPTARNLIAAFLDVTALPVVLIGGINLENVGLLPHLPRIYYAVISDAFRFGATREGIKKYVLEFGATSHGAAASGAAGP